MVGSEFTSNASLPYLKKPVATIIGSEAPKGCTEDKPIFTSAGKSVEHGRETIHYKIRDDDFVGTIVVTSEVKVVGRESTPIIGGTSADFDDCMLSVTKNIGVETTIHGVLASLGVTPSASHSDGALARGSFGRATHVKCITPDSSSLCSSVDDFTIVEDTVWSGEGGSRPGRVERYRFNRGPGYRRNFSS